MADQGFDKGSTHKFGVSRGRLTPKLLQGTKQPVYETHKCDGGFNTCNHFTQNNYDY